MKKLVIFGCFTLLIVFSIMFASAFWPLDQLFGKKASITGNAVDGTSFSNTASCSDSDQGIFSFVAGNVSTRTPSLFGPKYRTYKDYCKNQNTLYEYYCKSSGGAREKINCPKGTICKKESCERELDIQLSLLPNHEDTAISIKVKVPTVKKLGNSYAITYRKNINNREEGWIPFLFVDNPNNKNELTAVVNFIGDANNKFILEPNTEYVLCIEELFGGSPTNRNECKKIRTQSYQKSDVLIFIDENIQKDKNIAGLINQWKSYIKSNNDFLDNIEVIPIKSSMKNEDLYDLLKLRYRTSHLDYVLFMGWDFPLLKNDDLSSIQDFKCLSVNNSINLDWINENACQNEIVLSIIKPPIKYDSGGKELLEKYFQRLIKYYKEQMVFEKKILFADFMIPSERGLYPKHFYKLQKRYSDLNTNYISGMTDYFNQKENNKYLEIYSNYLINNSYEIIYLNAHGSPSSHYPSSVNRNFILSSKPKAKIIIPVSCSIGDFTIPNYVAGSYIFDGESLAIAAASTPFIDVSFISENIETYGSDIIFDLLINKNQTVGMSTKFYGLNIIGDPFIKI